MIRQLETPLGRCFLVGIFNDIKTNRQSFERYYPAIRISPSCGAVINFLEAVVLNDDFYAFLCDSIRD